MKNSGFCKLYICWGISRDQVLHKSLHGARTHPDGCRYGSEPEVDEDEEAGVSNAARDKIYDKGQSRRIWGELYKVVDSSDVIVQVAYTEQIGCFFVCPCIGSVCFVAVHKPKVKEVSHGTSCTLHALSLLQCVHFKETQMIAGKYGFSAPHDQPVKLLLQVLDARDPLGTRCRHLEQHIKKNARHKHMLLLINKCDLVGCCCIVPSPDFPHLHSYLMHSVLATIAGVHIKMLYHVSSACRQASALFGSAGEHSTKAHLEQAKPIDTAELSQRRHSAGASLGDKEVVRVLEWGVPVPGLPCQHHQPLWQG